MWQETAKAEIANIKRRLEQGGSTNPEDDRNRIKELEKFIKDNTQEWKSLYK